MIRKRNVKCAMSVLLILAMLCSFYGCGSREDSGQSVSTEEADDRGEAAKKNDSAQIAEAQATAAQTSGIQASGAQSIVQEAQSGEDLDVVESDPADDKWYMAGSVYTDENGRRLEVYFDDEGMLQFAVDGLSLYYTSADDFQQENNWRIYTCDDGTVIIYYPGTPAHLEISDGDYAGLYEAGDNKAE